MSFEVYDYRTTNRNVLITPEIRARLYHMKPSQADRRHSHDLGHEIFLILDGLAEFTINGETKVLGPGQMCIALADEIHQVRNLLPDKETVMYLSVTPHVHPTHTGRNDDDSKQPPQFNANANYHAEDDLSVSVETLLEQFVGAAQKVADAAQTAAQAQAVLARQLKTARAVGDKEAATAARNAMWDEVYRLHKALYAADQVWNAFSPRAVEG